MGFIGTVAIVLGVLFDALTFELWHLGFPVLFAVGVVVLALNFASVFKNFFEGFGEF